MCMYVHVCVLLHTNMYLHNASTHVHAQEHVYEFVYVYAYVCASLRVRSVCIRIYNLDIRTCVVNLCICKCVHMCAYASVCENTYTCVYG